VGGAFGGGGSLMGEKKKKGQTGGDGSWKDPGWANLRVKSFTRGLQEGEIPSESWLGYKKMGRDLIRAISQPGGNYQRRGKEHINI